MSTKWDSEIFLRRWNNFFLLRRHLTSMEKQKTDRLGLNEIFNFETNCLRQEDSHNGLNIASTSPTSSLLTSSSLSSSASSFWENRRYSCQTQHRQNTIFHFQTDAEVVTDLPVALKSLFSSNFLELLLLLLQLFSQLKSENWSSVAKAPVSVCWTSLSTTTMMTTTMTLVWTSTKFETSVTPVSSLEQSNDFNGWSFLRPSVSYSVTNF